MSFIQLSVEFIIAQNHLKDKNPKNKFSLGRSFPPRLCVQYYIVQLDQPCMTIYRRYFFCMLFLLRHTVVLLTFCICAISTNPSPAM